MNIHNNKAVIDEILKKYHHEDYQYTIVPSIRGFLKKIPNNLYVEKDDTRLAITIPRLKVLLLKDTFRDNDIGTVISGINYRDNKTWSMSVLNSEIGDVKRFFIHTLLHEIAHMEGYPQNQEAEADNWAFGELRKLDPSFFERLKE